MSGEDFVAAIRSAAPYIHAHHGRTFVVAFPGEICARPDMDQLLADIALLASLGIRLVLVHGARPQIEAELALRGITSRFVADRRVTDAATMQAVKAAVGMLRAGIEARLVGSRAGRPQPEQPLRVVGGTWVSAQPLGVHAGVDHEYTGLVRGVAIAQIRQALATGQVVLISPIGHSPVGDTYNLRNADVAEAVATSIGADKLIFVIESEPSSWRGPFNADGSGQLPTSTAERLLAEEVQARRLSAEDLNCVRAAVHACAHGVRRTHLIGPSGAGPLLQELFTRDGCGVMISDDGEYESTRSATLEDVAGIAELIEPLGTAGLLIPRSREQLERDIDQFAVITRDGEVIACNALIPYPGEAKCELACVAVHPGHRGRDLATALLRRARVLARENQFGRLFALTTRSPGWFLEHGFTRGSRADLPTTRQEAYDESRNSIVLLDDL